MVENYDHAKLGELANNLKRMIDLKDAEITKLREELDAANFKFEVAETEIACNEATIKELRSRIATLEKFVRADDVLHGSRIPPVKPAWGGSSSYPPEAVDAWQKLGMPSVCCRKTRNEHYRFIINSIRSDRNVFLYE